MSRVANSLDVGIKNLDLFGNGTPFELPLAPVMDAEFEFTNEGPRPPAPAGNDQIRSVAVLIAEGKTPTQIAELLGIPLEKVNTIISWPETTDVIKNLPKSDLEALTSAMFHGTTLEAIQVLRNLMNNVGGKVPANVQMSSAINLLDRALGKPESVTKTTAPRAPGLTSSSDPTTRAEEIVDQLSKLFPGLSLASLPNGQG